ncbi:MAG: uracil-DNA glycosylase [Chloroflexota bacterium]|nr:uracil-DNA glycosylase [Chloroflexota bacterium]
MVNDTESIRTKEKRLNQLAQEITRLDRSPLYQYRKKNDYKPVFGEGNPDADIMFIGEAPGVKEAETGRPFVGRAGQYLNSLLSSIDLKRADVYITNIVKDRPPSNRNPHAAEIDIYAPFLCKQINIIQPKVIATLGRFATAFIIDLFHLPQAGKKIGEIHGVIMHTPTDFGKVYIIPMYHPAAVFYNRNLAGFLEKDFYTLKLLC